MQAAVVDDIELLARYGRDGDESAFAALVARYVNLVYSAAARRAGARHLAEDVTQAVFVILSQKARSIRGDVPLSSWLLTTVRYAAATRSRWDSDDGNTSAPRPPPRPRISSAARARARAIG